MLGAPKKDGLKVQYLIFPLKNGTVIICSYLPYFWTTTIIIIDSWSVEQHWTETDEYTQLHWRQAISWSHRLTYRSELPALTPGVGEPSTPLAFVQPDSFDQRTRNSWALMSKPPPAECLDWLQVDLGTASKKDVLTCHWKLRLWILVNMGAVHSNSSKGRLTRSTKKWKSSETIIGSRRWEMTGSKGPSPSNKFRGMSTSSKTATLLRRRQSGDQTTE